MKATYLTIIDVNELLITRALFYNLVWWCSTRNYMHWKTSILIKYSGCMQI